MCVTVTDHAQKRIRERVGLPKRAVEKNAERALKKGIKHSQLSGRVKKFVDALYFKYQTANNIRIYENSVYLFAGGILITVIDLPQKYRKIVREISSKEERV